MNSSIILCTVNGNEQTIEFQFPDSSRSAVRLQDAARNSILQIAIETANINEDNTLVGPVNSAVLRAWVAATNLLLPQSDADSSVECLKVRYTVQLSQDCIGSLI